MINSVQCKMARAALGWSIQNLAKSARVGIATIVRFEGGKADTIPATTEAIQRALEAAGIEFKQDGSVRLLGASDAQP